MALVTVHFWIVPAVVLGVMYLIYFVIRAIVMPAPALASTPPSGNPAGGGQPPIRGAVPMPPPPAAPAVPPSAAAAPPRRAERVRLQRRLVLPPKSPRQKLTDLLGSLLLSTAVAGAMAVVLSLIVTSNIELDRVFWLTGVGALANRSVPGSVGAAKENG